MKKQFVFTLSCLVLSIFSTLEAKAITKIADLSHLSLMITMNNDPKSDHNPERIYHKIDNDLCAVWEITKNLQIAYNYEQAKEVKEDGVFYYYDDDNELIQTQNYLPDGQVVIKSLFWHQNVCHIISLVCCKKNLVENKKVLKSLHEKIKLGQL
ncbi:MAG TPA: hypothetical protein PKD51_10260 [Saprospiraceae bacterium]|nr:hypothetical protein [Saprospiraceae bacterium]